MAMFMTQSPQPGEPPLPTAKPAKRGERSLLHPPGAYMQGENHSTSIDARRVDAGLRRWTAACRSPGLGTGSRDAGVGTLTHVPAGRKTGDVALCRTYVHALCHVSALTRCFTTS